LSGIGDWVLGIGYWGLGNGDWVFKKILPHFLHLSYLPYVPYLPHPQPTSLNFVLCRIFYYLLLKTEFGAKLTIRYVKIKPGYKRSLPLTTRKAASRGLGTSPAIHVGQA
jgi:hypothetical protein